MVKRILILMMVFSIVVEGWGSYGQPTSEEGRESGRNPVQLESLQNDLRIKKIQQRRLTAKENIQRGKISKMDAKILAVETELNSFRDLLEFRRKNLAQISWRLNIFVTDSSYQEIFLYVMPHQKLKLFDPPTNCGGRPPDWLAAKYLWSRHRAQTIAQLKKERDKELYACWEAERRVIKMQKSYQDVYGRKNELVGEFQRKREVLEKEIRDLESLTDNLTQKVGQTRKQVAVNVVRSQKIVYPFSKNKKRNHFFWPVKGEVVTCFGKQKLEDLDANYVCNGIKIRTSPNEPVIAADRGKIVYAKKLKGYGRMVIIEHKKELLTIYAHLGEIIGEVGETIKKGDILGRVSGGIKDAEIYFEIRYKGRPDNPLNWLTR